MQINSVHITSKDDCYIVSIDHLPGGMAEDYQQHIWHSLNRLADIYSTYTTAKSYEVCQRQMITNIAITMTDRAIINHDTIVHLCEECGKSLNELNCNQWIPSRAPNSNGLWHETCHQGKQILHKPTSRVNSTPAAQQHHIERCCVDPLEKIIYS